MTHKRNKVSQDFKRITVKLKLSYKKKFRVNSTFKKYLQITVEKPLVNKPRSSNE